MSAPQINGGDAHRRAEEIRATLANLATGRDRVLDLIRQARDNGDHEQLGYPSWTAYVSGEFGEHLPRLQRSERQPLVAQLRALGMTPPTIAPIVGTTDDTVRNDLRQTNPENAGLPPATGADGRIWQPRPRPTTPAPDSEWRCETCGGVDSVEHDDPDDCHCGCAFDDCDQLPRSEPTEAELDHRRRRAAWQPFRALMSSTVETFIDGTEDLIAGHEWEDLDKVHNRLGIDSRAAVLNRLQALRAAADRVLGAWQDQKPITNLRRIK